MQLEIIEKENSVFFLIVTILLKFEYAVNQTDLIKDNIDVKVERELIFFQIVTILLKRGMFTCTFI